MNCKPMELVVIVSAAGSTGLAGEVAREAIGRIARVTTYGPRQGKFETMYPEVWQFEEPLRIMFKGVPLEIIGCADEALRPIRDNPGEDESLQWEPVPGQKVTA